MGLGQAAGVGVLKMLLLQIASQLAAISVVALYVVSRTRAHPQPGHFLARLALVSAASWISEESSIVLYSFYGYHPAPSLFLGHVPALVIIIWPVVIHSARDLATQLLSPSHRFIPLAAAAIVFTDASLIEPVAVNADLWSWNQPGIFNVPPIGILGWSYFALLCTLLLEQGERRNSMNRYDLLILVLPVIGTHLLLLGTWWGALRWVNAPINPAYTAWAAWALSLLLVYAILRRKTGRHVERKTLLLRLPAAVLFFALIVAFADRSPLLVIYAVAFVPPYLTLMAQQYSGYKTPTAS